MKELRVGSDFSGVGAFDQALMRLGVPYRTVFACDWDKYARQTYVHNYGDPEYYPCDVYEREIPSEPLDIFVSSPPCQSFSIAGKRGGEEDKRGILFYNSLEFIAKNKPEMFIFENVKGLLSDDGGRTFGKWVELLGGKSVNGQPVLFPHGDSVPYNIYWSVLNAKDYGIPQNRERVFIVGFRGEATFRWPVPVPLDKCIADVLEPVVDDKYWLSEKMLEGFKIHADRHNGKGNGFAFEPKEVDDVSSAITTGYGSRPTDTYIKGYENPGVSNTLTTVEKDNVVAVRERIRRFTPRECFRLMDFPDTFTWPVSDSQAYKQAGNSIAVGVLAAIIERMLGVRQG